MSQSEPESAYQRAGVDIDAQDRALARVKKLVASTRTAGVLSELGSFGGLYELPSGVESPVLVASADGVGTKLAVAKLAGDYSTVGEDLVNHCVNDILVQGARPLFFMDYVGAGVLDPQCMEELVGGVARGCRANGCALLGGETAEMPGFYQPGDYELVGFIVGLAAKSEIFDGSRVRERDVLVGLPSAGLHTNGFSLARKVLLEERGLALDDQVTEAGETVREVLLGPHVSYLKNLEPLLDHAGVHAMAHITGGGLTDNVPRVLSDDTHAEIRLGTWEIPDLFYKIQEWGGVESDEMFRVFNMGVGMVLVVDPAQLGDVLKSLQASGTKGFPLGTVQGGGSGVVYHLEKDLGAKQPTGE